MPDVINNPALGMYVAAAVALVVMLGFFVYLWSLDRQVRELRRQLDWTRPETSSQTLRQERHEPLRPTRIEKELSDGFDRR